jgi:hypothetical protein
VQKAGLSRAEIVAYQCADLDANSARKRVREALAFCLNNLTAQLRSITRSQSSIGVASGGTINNTGDTLNADGTAPVVLLGGAIQGGTITSTNGGEVVGSPAMSTLDTVTLDAPLVGGDVTANNLVNNSTITIHNNGVFLAEGTWTNNGVITTSNSAVALYSMPTSIGSSSITGN